MSDETFHIFKRLKKNIKRRLFRDTWNCMKFKFQCPPVKFFGTQPRSFICVLCASLCAARAELNSYDWDCVAPKIFTIWPFIEKKCADPWFILKSGRPCLRGCWWQGEEQHGLWYASSSGFLLYALGGPVFTFGHRHSASPLESRDRLRRAAPLLSPLGKKPPECSPVGALVPVAAHLTSLFP